MHLLERFNVVGGQKSALSDVAFEEERKHFRRGDATSNVGSRPSDFKFWPPLPRLNKPRLRWGRSLLWNSRRSLVSALKAVALSHVAYNQLISLNNRWRVWSATAGKARKSGRWTFFLPSFTLFVLFVGKESFFLWFSGFFQYYHHIVEGNTYWRHRKKEKKIVGLPGLDYTNAIEQWFFFKTSNGGCWSLNRVPATKWLS